MKYFLNFFILSCLLFTTLNGVSPPKPIVGSPNILTPKFSGGSGPFVFEIDVPPKWGIGSVSISPDGSAYFELYPEQGGNGCTIEVQRHDSNDQAVDKLNNIRNKFKHTKNLDAGFEAELSHAWFSCRVNGQFLIQMWYSLPKKSSKHKNHWKNLKSCINILNVEDSIDTTPKPILPIPKPIPPFPKPIPLTPIPHTFEESQPEHRELVEKTFNGWIFNHPTKNKSVFFELFHTGTLRDDDAFSYLISFDDIMTNISGYFYLEWDQTHLDTTDPYQYLADKMSQEIKAIHPNQNFNPIEFIPGQGATMAGYPYGIIVASGDDFLIGLVIKRNMDFRDFDVVKLLNKIKWSD